MRASNAARCSSSGKSTASSRSPTVLGSVHGQAQRLESRTGRVGPPGFGPRLGRRTGVGARGRRSRSVRAGSRCPPPACGAGPLRHAAPAHGPQGVGLETTAVGHHHQVLVAHQLVGMLGHHGQSRLGRLGPALGGAQVGRTQDPVDAKARGTAGPPRWPAAARRGRREPDRPGPPRGAGRPRPRRPRDGAPTRRRGWRPPRRRRRRRKRARPAWRSCAGAGSAPRPVPCRTSPRRAAVPPGRRR